MLQVLLVTFPFFALVLAGYLARPAQDAAPGGDSWHEHLRAVFCTALHVVPVRIDHPLAQLLDGALFFTYLSAPW